MKAATVAIDPNLASRLAAAATTVLKRSILVLSRFPIPVRLRAISPSASVVPSIAYEDAGAHWQVDFISRAAPESDCREEDLESH